jgi:chromate transporter
MQKQYSLKDLIWYFLKLGTVGFGGPVALVGYMQRDLVEKKQWIPLEDFKEGLALSQLAPGPLAAQLAIYLGYVHYKILGATLAGIAFVLPSFLMVLAIGWAYTTYGGLPLMQAIFYGVGASVIGIIAVSAYKLTLKSIGKDKLLWGIFGVAILITVITEQENVFLFLLSGVVYWLSQCFSATYAYYFVKFLFRWESEQLVENYTLFCQSRCFCIWKWFGDCTIFVWWRGQRVSVAQRTAIH